MNKRPIVCDTTLLLYLDRIHRLQLLSSLYEGVKVPEQVMTELDMGRMIRRDTMDPRSYPWMSCVSVADHDIASLPPNALGIGERAVIAYARAHSRCWTGLDDKQARDLAESLNLDVVGILGILLRVKKTALIPFVGPLLQDLRRERFHLGDDIVATVLEMAGETEF